MVGWRPFTGAHKGEKAEARWESRPAETLLKTK